MNHRLLIGIAAAALVIPALAYLRDPPWLEGLEAGFGGWEAADDGTRYRWISGHASFFVSADASTITIPLRTIPDPAWPITVSITIDDRPADRLELRDGAWHFTRLRLPPRSSRRTRRIDLRADRTRTGNRGVQVGVVAVE